MKEPQFRPALWIAPAAALVVALVWVFGLVGFIAGYRPGPPGLTVDPFTALASLFTGLAFAGTLGLIAMQADDLRLTRRELSEQAAQMNRQASLLEDQQFQSMFFGLLTLHHEIVAKLRTSGDSGTHREGREMLQLICSELFRH